MTDLILAAEQLTRSFDGRLAVEQVQLRLHAGDILGLLGPNGAGKTTLMQLCAGVLTPSSGSIRVLDRQPFFDAKVRASIGYLPDTPPLYPGMTVQQQLRFAGQLYCLSASEIKIRIVTLLQQLELGEVAGQLNSKLSKGLRQRVGLAQALLHQPRLLILDEPANGLDPLQNSAFRQLLRSLNPDMAVLLSTHHLGDIQALCSHVMLLHHGRTVFTSEVADIDNSETSLERIFIQHIHQSNVA